MATCGGTKALPITQRKRPAQIRRQGFADREIGPKLADFAADVRADAAELRRLAVHPSDLTRRHSRAGIITNGKVATLEQAKAAFEASWRRWLDWAKLIGIATLAAG